jgi:hypothetical protein
MLDNERLTAREQGAAAEFPVVADIVSRRLATSRPLHVIILSSIEQILIFRHWAGVRLYTEYYYVAKSCVFAKQFPICTL